MTFDTVRLDGQPIHYTVMNNPADTTTSPAAARPRGWLKLLFRMPVLIHSLGFAGWEQAIGASWMLITSVGRRSGKPHKVMVDVLKYDRQADVYFVAAAYGAQSDWYRNIRANGSFAAQAGGRKFVAVASAVSTEQAMALAVEFARRVPGYMRWVFKLIGQYVDSESALREKARTWLVLRVAPQPESPRP